MNGELMLLIGDNQIFYGYNEKNKLLSVIVKLIIASRKNQSDRSPVNPEAVIRKP